MASSKKPNQKKKDEASWPLILAALIFLLGVYLVVSALSPKGKVIEPADPRSAEFTHKEKVEYYKRSLGQKLNRSRTIAEFEYYKEQEIHNPRGETLEPPDSTDGLPLDYEHHDWAPREESKMAEGYKPDQAVAYNLRDQQNSEFWEEEAQRLFLRQYIINARSKGYDVAIDHDYNVIVKRYPQNAGHQRIPQSVGSDFEKYSPLRFAPPFFIRPICQR